jgi:hypothetical protein
MAFILLGSKVCILLLGSCSSGYIVETASKPDAKGIRDTSDGIREIRVERLKVDHIYLLVRITPRGSRSELADACLLQQWANNRFDLLVDVGTVH